MKSSDINLLCYEDGKFKILQYGIRNRIGCAYTIARDVPEFLFCLSQSKKPPSAILIYDDSLGPCDCGDTPQENLARDFLSQSYGSNIASVSRMPGIVLLKAIRSNAAYSKIPVAVLAVYEKEPFIRAGADVVFESSEMSDDFLNRAVAQALKVDSIVVDQIANPPAPQIVGMRAALN